MLNVSNISEIHEPYMPTPLSAENRHINDGLDITVKNIGYLFSSMIIFSTLFSVITDLIITYPRMKITKPTVLIIAVCLIYLAYILFYEFYLFNLGRKVAVVQLFVNLLTFMGVMWICALSCHMFNKNLDEMDSSNSNIKV